MHFVIFEEWVCDVPLEVCMSDPASQMLFPIVCYCVAGSSMVSWCRSQLESVINDEPSPHVDKQQRTLIASVWMVAMTSRDPSRMRLLARLGLYSQMAEVVAITAILVMWDMMSIFVRLITCSKHLYGGLRCSDGTWITVFDSWKLVFMCGPLAEVSVAVNHFNCLTKHTVAWCIIEGHCVQLMDDIKYGSHCCKAEWRCTLDFWGPIMPIRSQSPTK